MERPNNWDFSGWATRPDVTCDDGRTIAHDAFADHNGKKVPLCWNHQHGTVGSTLGHAILESRDGGLYAYCYLNDTEAGKQARECLKHGDLDSLSIWANKLKQTGSVVKHGVIRELSLVLSGANPVATIDNVVCHSADGFDTVDIEEANILFGDIVELSHSITGENEAPAEEEPAAEPVEEPAAEGTPAEEPIEHAADPSSGHFCSDVLEHMSEEKKEAAYTILAGIGSNTPIPDEDRENAARVFDTFTEDEKTALSMAASVVKHSAIDIDEEDADDDNSELKHSATEGENTMRNDIYSGDVMSAEQETFLNHSADFAAIIADGERFGKLSAAFKANLGDDFDACMAHGAVLAHSATYGIEGVEYLYPDYQKTRNEPYVLDRDQAWVSTLLNGVHHVPYGRIKVQWFDIEDDEARALGYVTGDLKKEEVIELLQRTKDPQTIYKKQKFDRDILIDADFDILVFIRKEMRGKLNEEIARAILVGDGRNALSQYKIKEAHVQPVWTDAELFAKHTTFVAAANATDDEVGRAFIVAVKKGLVDYEGSGDPICFATREFITDCLLIEDTNARVIYETVGKLADAIGVAKIVFCPIMKNLTRTVDGVTRYLSAIIFNPKDYVTGTDKRGEVNFFEDFDIDYNQQKVLIETRLCGMLEKPRSALVVERTFQ